VAIASKEAEYIASKETASSLRRMTDSTHRAMAASEGGSMGETTMSSIATSPRKSSVHRFFRARNFLMEQTIGQFPEDERGAPAS
jgi:hypothetical protein